MSPPILPISVLWSGAVRSPDEAIDLRVARAGKEYWARWGYSARIRERQCSVAGSARA